MVFTNSFSGCCPPNTRRLYPKDFPSIANSRNNDILMIIYKPSKVLRRTLQGSSENPPRFFREPSKVLFLTIKGVFYYHAKSKKYPLELKFFSFRQKKVACPRSGTELGINRCHRTWYFQAWAIFIFGKTLLLYRCFIFCMKQIDKIMIQII